MGYSAEFKWQHLFSQRLDIMGFIIFSIHCYSDFCNSGLSLYVI